MTCFSASTADGACAQASSNPCARRCGTAGWCRARRCRRPGRSPAIWAWRAARSAPRTASLPPRGTWISGKGRPCGRVWQPRYRPAPALASPRRRLVPDGTCGPACRRAEASRQAWARAQRQVLGHAPDEAFGYADPLGSTRLRQVLAEYLGRTRESTLDPASLLILPTGFTQAFTLICHVLHAQGIANLAVEDPSDPRYRRIAHGAGLSVTPVPCDRDGLQVAKLTRSRARAVLITPAHQFPLGVTMSATRRTALVEWARHRQALIIEDDYDGEFRYDRQPVGALQALDPGHVIYGGTVSKTLAPGLRLGWLSLPGSLIGTFRAAKDDLDRCTGVMEQLAFAELIASGAFDQHVRRMRTRYRHRRDELAQAFAATRPDLRLSGTSAGLHALVYLSGQELVRTADPGPRDQALHRPPHARKLLAQPSRTLSPGGHHRLRRPSQPRLPSRPARAGPGTGGALAESGRGSMINGNAICTPRSALLYRPYSGNPGSLS